MDLKFIDLFCGIGGFHQAILRSIPNAKCVLSSDFDKNVQKTYELNYGITPLGDIKNINIETIPEFSLLCAGFPCQAFSSAGKKNAFNDPRGTLFFDMMNIIKYHNPSTIILENVANLVTINNGMVFDIIVDELKSCGYNVSYRVLSPHQFGVPQSRDRVYIVASLKKEFDFSDLARRSTKCKLEDILETNIPESAYIDPSKYVLLPEDIIKTQPKSGLRFCGYLLGELRKKGARENTEHLSRVHKQTARIHSYKGNIPTLSASETSGRYHICDDKGVRKLTLNECYKLMDYPDTFKKHSVKGSAYRQIGNSVCVKVIENIVKEMLKQDVL
jgi:DNA (cytosine-5)-methyltransferase 1